MLAHVSLITAALWTAAAENPVELGAVEWQRDFDRALETARAADKPILLLFQEVPG